MKLRIFLPVFLLFFSITLHASDTVAKRTYQKAVKEFAAGKFISSKGDFERTLRTTSRSRDLHIRAKSCSYLGDIYFYMGDKETALEYYRRAMDDKKIRSGVRYRIGRTLVTLGNYNEGMTELREFLVHKSAREGLEDHALYWIARAYQGLGQKENALKTLDILTDLNPSTGLKNTVARYRAELKKWDQREEYKSDLKKIFPDKENDAGIEKGIAVPEESSGLEDNAVPEEIASAPETKNLAVSSAPEGEMASSSEPSVEELSVDETSSEEELPASSVPVTAVSSAPVKTVVSSSLSSRSSSSRSSQRSSSSGTSKRTAVYSSSSYSSADAVMSTPVTLPDASNSVVLKFILTEDYRVQKALLLPFFDDRLIGDFEDIRKESTYHIASYMDPDKPDETLPGMPEDVYLKDKMKTIAFGAKGKGVLRLIQYGNVRMFQTSKQLQGDILAIQDLIRNNKLPKWKENQMFPNAFGPEYNAGLMFVESIDTDKTQEISYRLKPVGLMIGAMGVIWLEKDTSR
jgi:tetratricopeptide (TPR) repeat protein